jgi:hypothetical protein
MSPLQRLACGTVFALGLSVGVASAATTTSQLVELSRAGLDDDILIALIQTDGSTFQLTADDILVLHKQGLSDRVIRAMQETARPPAVLPIPVEPEIIAVPAPPPPPPPTVVNVYETVTPRVDPPAEISQPYYTIPIAVPVYVGAPVVRDQRPEKPMYWGWGGQRRPDSWQPDPGPRREPAQQTPVKNKGGS